MKESTIYSCSLSDGRLHFLLDTEYDQVDA